MVVVSYDDIKNKFKTGDIIYFSHSNIVGLMIKFFNRSHWTHIGMIYKEPEFDDQLLIYESKFKNNLPDLRDNKVKGGAILVRLEDRLRTDKGDVAFRQLTKPLTIEQKVKLNQFMKEMLDVPFEKHFFEMVKASYKGKHDENEEDLESVFCSELLAATYQRMGLLRSLDEGGLPSNEYIPRYFTAENENELDMLTNNFGPEFHLDMKNFHNLYPKSE